MAVVQGLNHFHSIVFAHAFAELGVSVPETISVASPIYKLRMQLMGRILAQDPNLYAEMELHNPYVIPALKSLQASAEKFFTAIESGSSEQCIQFFKQAADNFGSYRNQALSESNLVLSKINALLSNEKR
jgi:prephenate dehydrogenase